MVPELRGALSDYCLVFEGNRFILRSREHDSYDLRSIAAN
jgi:hypothetical protein